MPYFWTPFGVRIRVRTLCELVRSAYLLIEMFFFEKKKNGRIPLRRTFATNLGADLVLIE